MFELFLTSHLKLWTACITVLSYSCLKSEMNLVQKRAFLKNFGLLRGKEIVPVWLSLHGQLSEAVAN